MSRSSAARNESSRDKASASRQIHAAAVVRQLIHRQQRAVVTRVQIKGLVPGLTIRDKGWHGIMRQIPGCRRVLRQISAGKLESAHHLFAGHLRMAKADRQRMGLWSRLRLRERSDLAVDIAMEAMASTRQNSMIRVTPKPAVTPYATMTAIMIKAANMRKLPMFVNTF